MNDDTLRDDIADMSPDELRRWGHAMIEWVAGYRERVGELPVLSQLRPGEVRAALPPAAPEEGEPFDRILADVDRIILPGVTHWQSPSFFAYFPGNSSGPSVLGELLSAGLGVQGMLWATSPACTELEAHVLDWLVDMMGLPASFKSDSSGGGVIQDSASSANLCAILAARERATGGEGNRLGCDRRLVAYASAETHSSVAKGIRVAGIGDQNLRVVAVDDALALRPDELARRIDADRDAGLVPFFVCATVGTTSSNAMDPLRPIAEVCRSRGVWVHVDAAMAGTSALCPELRHLHEGVELVDSYCFDPHKWMFTNFDCSVLWVADRRALVDALSITPEYLRNRASESGEVIDYRDWHVPLGRRFRSLKLWFVIRHFGAEGLRRRVRRHVALAQELLRWIETEPVLEVAAPAPLNLVCFRHRAGEEATQALLDGLNQSGRLFLTSTRLGGKLTLRVCVGQTHTEKAHVEAAWEDIRSLALAIESAGTPRQD